MDLHPIRMEDVFGPSLGGVCHCHHGQRQGFWQVSWEPLNGFMTDSHGRHVWSLTQTSLKVKVNLGGQCVVCGWKNIFAVV